MTTKLVGWKGELVSLVCSSCSSGAIFCRCLVKCVSGCCCEWRLVVVLADITCASRTQDKSGDF